ncbi:MAG: hypothetical protein R2690_08055 [Acidimicrobiales bacterium]
MPGPPPSGPPMEKGVPSEPAGEPGVRDPNQLGAAAERLSPESFRNGRVALAILSVHLRQGEYVQAIVQGAYQGYAAVGVLTDQRILLVNDHEWVADVREVPIATDLKVQGLQDDKTASLTFIVDGVGVTISAIGDRPLAHEMAQLVRGRVAELGG